MDVSRITAALGLLSAVSALAFASGLALVFRYLGPSLVMGAHIYAGNTEPSEASLPFPTVGVLGCLVVAVGLATRAKRSAKWSAASVAVSLLAFIIELRWLVALYEASGA